MISDRATNRRLLVLGIARSLISLSSLSLSLSSLVTEEQVQSRRFQLGRERERERGLIIEMQTGWIDDISPDSLSIRLIAGNGKGNNWPTLVIDAVVRGIRLAGGSRD